MEKQSSVVPLANIDITDRELRHLAAAWLASSGNASIDFEVFTILTGHPNTVNARKRFGEIKKRIRDQVFSENGEAPASVPSTPQKRKLKTNGDVTPSSTKKNKAVAAKENKSKEATERKVKQAAEQETYKIEVKAVKKEFAEYASSTDFGL